jgi:DNA-binding MarR family transcriptional regulator
VPKKYDFSNSTPLLLRGAYLSLHRHAHARYSEAAAITADQFVFMSLLEEESGLTQKELGRRAYSDANTTTNMLKLLEKRGLVERKTDQRDRRAILVYLTPQGRKVQKLVATGHTALDPRLRELMNAEKNPVVVQWLRDVLTAYQEDYQQNRKDRPGRIAIVG